MHADRRRRLAIAAVVLVHASSVSAWDPDKDPVFAPRPRSTGFPEPRACPGTEPIHPEIAAQLEVWSMPVYPADALADGWENDVELHVEVDETGKVTTVMPETGDSPFQDAAWRAVSKWTFKPCLGPLGKPSRCSLDLTVCFAGGKVTITGVHARPPTGAGPGRLARWRSLAGRKGYPKPPPQGTVAWALNLRDALDAARRKPTSSAALRDAYDRVFIAYGECAACRKVEYHYLKDALRAYFNDQAAINEVQAEEYAEDAATFPGGTAEPGATCQSCREELNCLPYLGNPLADLQDYLWRCRDPLSRCPDREQLWWMTWNVFGSHASRDPAIVRTFLDTDIPTPMRAFNLLRSADALRARDPARALDLEKQAYREAGFPAALKDSFDLRGRVAAAEARNDLETALFLLLVAGTPMVTCGNDVFSGPEYRFHVAYLQVRLGMEPRARLKEMLDLVPDDPSSFLLAHFLHPQYLDQLEKAARLVHEEDALAARLGVLRKRFADARARQEAGDARAAYGNARDAEQLLGGYISELRRGSGPR